MNTFEKQVGGITIKVAPKEEGYRLTVKVPTSGRFPLIESIDCRDTAELCVTAIRAVSEMGREARRTTLPRRSDISDAILLGLRSEDHGTS